MMEKSPRADGTLSERAEHIRARLCRLDVVVALATDHRSH
jgi:hypothetical protein